MLSFNSFTALFCLVPAQATEAVYARLEEAVDAFRDQVAADYQGYDAHVGVYASEIANDTGVEDLVEAFMARARDVVASRFGDFH